MTIMNKVMMGGAGLAAFVAAAPAAAQYYYPPAYGYNNYGNNYSYNNGTEAAAQRCAAAVQERLSNRNSTNIFGMRTASAGRVLSVTQVNPNRNSVRVRGLATTGAPYGLGAFGILGSNYNQQADLSFKCDVDYRGYIRDIDINRR